MKQNIRNILFVIRAR